MARKRVIFIAGLGEFVPGSISNISQATSYVKKGFSSISSSSRLAKTAVSLINPVAGVTLAALTKSGASQPDLGSLGLPQGMQNIVSSAINMGGLFVQLDLNPQRVTEERPKIQTKIPTDSGFGILHWGLDLVSLAFEIQTKSTRFGDVGDTGARQKQSSVNSAKATKDNLSQLKKFFDVNNFNIGLIYENSIYIGHFEGKFKSTRDSQDPNIIKSSFMFVIDKQPQIVIPGLGIFSLNKLPFPV